MSIWPRSLRFLWEEESGPMRVGPLEAQTEPTGVPGLLQRVTRWTAIAVVGATLIGQIIGIRLIGPVDADCTQYSNSQCRQCCVDTICAGKTGRAYLQCYASAAVAACCARCPSR